MKRRDVVSLIGLTTVGGLVPALTACGGGDDGDLNIRLLNLLADSADVTLRVDGSDRTTASFETATGYFGEDSGIYTTEYVARSTGAVLFSESYTYNKDVYYSKIGVGIDGSTGFTTLADNEERPSDNEVKVRLSNLVANGQTYDLFLTSPSVEINNAAATIGNLGVNGTSGFAERSSGGLRVRVTRAGTRDLVYDSGGAFDFSSRHVVTLLLYSKGSGELVGCFALFGKDNPGRSQVIANTLARIRIVNGTESSERIGVTVDGTSLFNGIPANAASSYQVLGAGARQFSVVTQSGATILANFSGDMVAGRDHTLIVRGTAGGGYTGTITQDLNPRARTGFVKMRATNAARDGAVASLSINFRTDFPDIAPSTVTSSREYSPATYVFSGSFTIGGVTKTVDFGSYELETGKSYTANLFGDDAQRVLTITESL
jgi:Domain of unknown function (DUF4397)